MQYLQKKNPDTGHFPKYLVTINGNGHSEPYYAYTDAELKKLREEVEARIGRQLEIFSEDGSETTKESAFRWVELYSAQSLASLVTTIEKKGFSVQQYENMPKPICFLSETDGPKEPIHSLRELLNKVRDLGRKGLEIQRYKGLGEMNPEQLFNTTMAPDKRRLLKVVLEDAARADGIFNILMGDEVEPRRQFIEDNALDVKNLDI
jgi:DNA gyrase subunit B